MTRAIILFSLLLAGCSAPQEELVGKPPETGQVVEQSQPQAAPPPPQRRFPAPRLAIGGWPYHEPGNSFELTWTGGNKRAPLHAAPDPNSALLGDVLWDPGERILWNDSAVAVYEPRVVRATAEWFVEGPVYQDGFLVEEEFLALEIKPGDRLEIWAYGGDLQCYMSKRSKIFTGPCPPADRFKGLGQGPIPGKWYEPKKRAWWIQITGNNLSGWVPVDDRMTVDIVGP